LHGFDKSAMAQSYKRVRAAACGAWDAREATKHTQGMGPGVVLQRCVFNIPD